MRQAVKGRCLVVRSNLYNKNKNIFYKKLYSKDGLILFIKNIRNINIKLI
jgi:hypothetical protein